MLRIAGIFGPVLCATFGSVAIQFTRRAECSRARKIRVRLLASLVFLAAAVAFVMSPAISNEYLIVGLYRIVKMDPTLMSEYVVQPWLDTGIVWRIQLHAAAVVATLTWTATLDANSYWARVRRSLAPITFILVFEAVPMAARQWGGRTIGQSVCEASPGSGCAECVASGAADCHDPTFTSRFERFGWASFLASVSIDSSYQHSIGWRPVLHCVPPHQSWGRGDEIRCCSGIVRCCSGDECVRVLDAERQKYPGAYSDSYVTTLPAHCQVEVCD